MPSYCTESTFAFTWEQHTENSYNRMIGSVAVTVPCSWYLLQQGTTEKIYLSVPEPHGHGGHHEEEEEEPAEEPAEEPPKEEGGEEEAKSEDAPSDSSDDTPKDTPESSDDEGEKKEEGEKGGEEEKKVN
jgi:hypothetical protein